MFAVAAPGLEPLVLRECVALRLPGSTLVEGGVAFHGGLAELARANVGLAVASRVLLRLGSFRATTFHELMQKARKLPWAVHVQPGQPVCIRVTCRKSRLHHSGAVAERIHQSLPSPGALHKPSQQEESGAQQIMVRVEHDEATVSVDTSGPLLHVRGWRPHSSAAPLRETLAAALLDHAGWVPGVPLWDPFCGSGTILLEAASRAAGAPPGAHRSFAFEAWPGVPRRLVADTVAGLSRAAVSTRLLGGDHSAEALEAARHNATRLRAPVEFLQRAVAQGAPLPSTPVGMVVTNPPYGERLSRDDADRALSDLGAVLRAQLPGWKVCVILPARLVSRVGAALPSVLSTSNGGLNVVLAAGRVPPGGGA